MEKNSTIRAIQNAVESGAMKYGGSQMLNSYSPMPPVGEYEFPGWPVERELAIGQIRLDGLTAKGGVRARFIPWVSPEKTIFRAQSILIAYNEGEVIQVPGDTVTVDSVRSIQAIVVEIEEISTYTQILTIYGGDPVNVEGLRIDVEGDAYASPYTDGQSQVNYLQLPYKLTVTLPEGYKIEGWYKRDISPELYLGNNTEIYIVQDIELLLLNLE